MPTYDYKCEKCGHDFEEMLPIIRRHEPTEHPCPFPTCGGVVELQVAAPGFAYDNIPSKGHPKKTPDWMTDRLKDIKKNQPEATMNIPG